MRWISFAIRRKVLVAMLFISIVMLGYLSYNRLPVELLPSTELPFLIVQVAAVREMDPQYIEKQAILPLEGAISSMEGIDRIESFAERRSGRIVVYFNSAVRIKYVHLKLQERINAISAGLDEDFRVAILKVDTEQLSNMFMRLQVRGSGEVDRIRALVDRKVLRDLENIDGMARVEVIGGQQETVEIVLNEEACQAYAITANQIRRAISSQNRDKTYLGQVFEKHRRFFVSLSAEYADVRQLETVVVRSDGPVLLRDVARIYFGVKERTSISRVNGQQSVTLQLMREGQVNLIALSHATRAIIADLNRRLQSDGLEITVQSDAAEIIEKNIQLIKKLIWTGGVLAIAILWLFLRNIRILLVIALTIPISILMSMNFFYGFELSLNALTLVGIALAVGMLVDNSVVVLENIYRLLAAGNDRDQAVVRGSGEVWKSIFASTLTTVIVFLPFLFSQNFFIKILGRHIGLSIVPTLLMSLVVAMLLIPITIHTLIRAGAGQNRLNFAYISTKNRLVQIYALLLKSAMRFPARTVLGTAMVFFASLLICLGLSLNVPREVEVSEFPLYVTLPRGATLETADVMMMDLEKLLEDIPEKLELVSEIFEEEATLTVKLKDDFATIRNYSLAQVKAEIHRRVRNFRFAEVGFDRPQSSRRYAASEFGPGMGGMGLERLLGIGSQEEKVVLKGLHFELMKVVAEDIRAYLNELGNVQRASLSISENRPEIHVLLDPQTLSAANLSATSIATELASFQNEIATNLRYKQGVNEFDIVMRNEHLTDKTIEDLRTLRIQDESGHWHQLQEVSRIIYSQGSSGISRVNQEKQIEVRYSFQADVTGDKDLLEAARAEVDQVVASLRLPPGMVVETIHDDLDLSEFYFLLSAAFILIYMVMASVFESLWIPVVMMFTLPLAAIGSLWALILTGNSILNANALIGFLVLLGVVVNNGIIYIDFANILRQRGFRRSRALMMAGKSRVRPILITSLTTIIGMLPLAMGKAEYVTRIGSPFAIAMIGGLSLSTLFTLIFIPTVYTGLENTLSWFRRLSPPIRWLQIALMGLGIVWIYTQVDSTIWKFIDLFAWLVIIPASVYFVQSSLRRARSDYVKKEEPIQIRVQHLVKIYEEDSRFIREWKKGAKRGDASRTTPDSYRALAETWSWQIPLWLFLVYFIFFYLNSYIWELLFGQLLFFYTRYLWQRSEERAQSLRGRTRRLRLSQRMQTVFFWAYPLFFLAILQLKWHHWLITVFLLLLWYSLLIIYATGQKMDRDQLNIARVQGRFSGMQRSYYRFVRMIPWIGRHKHPFKALDSVTLEIGSGMFGLLGPNGAGKTTLMRIICGILQQSRGSIWINGISLKEQREELQGLIGYLPQEFGAYENMTAFEFLSYQSILKGIYDQTVRNSRIAYVLAAVHMAPHRDQKIASYSGGMKQRIGIAQTLLHLPRILVVDEPTAGLDPRERIRFRNLLVELSRERVVIFSTHIIEDISSSCSQVAVLNKGRLFYCGEPNKMVDRAMGKIWQVMLDPEEFESFQAQHQIVHHLRVHDQIRVRCLADHQPHERAEMVRPTLEDAYLSLLRSKEVA